MNGFELVASWFTPTVLFCVLNLIIGTIFITSSLRLRPQQNDDVHQPHLLRVPSLFERVKSINLSRYRSDQPDPDPIHQHEPETEEQHQVTRTKSETVTKTKLPAVKVLKKSFSEKAVAKEVVVSEEEQWRPATVREKTAAEDEEVDVKADDFINKFRQQLKLQRLDSILRYKEMINRGLGR